MFNTAPNSTLKTNLKMQIKEYFVSKFEKLTHKEKKI